MIRGETKQILLPPLHRTDLLPAETFVPDVLELRNGVYTRAGHWRRRPGYKQAFDLGLKAPVTALIPEGDGYAVTSNGRVYRLHPPATGVVRPTPRPVIESGAPLNPNHHWKMETAVTTSNVHDEFFSPPWRSASETFFDLAQVNGVTSPAGKFGLSSEFDRSLGQYLEAQDPEFGGFRFGIVGSNAVLTVACWIYRDDLQDGSIARQWEGAGTRQWDLRVEGNNAVFQVSAGGSSVTTKVTSVNIVRAGEWFLVVGWHDPVADVIGIQVNNAAAVTAAHSTGIHLPASETAFKVGVDFDGRIDSLSIWHFNGFNRTLNAAERAGLWNNGVGIDVPIAPGAIQPIIVETGTTWTSTPQALTEATTELVTDGMLRGRVRPTWANANGQIVIVNGNMPIAVQARRFRKLAGNPPKANFVAENQSYLILAAGDKDGVRFQWSSPADIDSWPAENFNEVLREGERIRMMLSLGHELWFFCDHHIEVWINIGGEGVWARQRIIRKGTLAGHSVVAANDTAYFLGDDRDFYVLDGDSPRVISAEIRAELDKLTEVQNIYGFDFRAEHAVRWFAQTNEKCFRYDYLNQVFSEDNTAIDSRLPFASHMELDGKTYLGDYTPTGLIYEWSQGYRTDNGTAIRVPRTMRVPLSADGTMAKVHRLRCRVQRERGAGAKSGPNTIFGIPAQILVRWRLDEKGWMPYRQLDLEKINMQRPFVDVHNLGVGREITLELVETFARKYLLTDVYLTVEGLSV